MTNKIMELVHHAIYAEESYVLSEYMNKIQEILEAQQDYTRAVISERDALKAELHNAQKWMAATGTGVQRDALRKAAQMALEAMLGVNCADPACGNDVPTAIRTLRKELGNV